MFQTIARRDERTLSEQCKEIEEVNRMGMTSDLFKDIREVKGTFHTKMGTIKDRNGNGLTEEEVKMWQNKQKKCTKKGLLTQIAMMVCSLTWSQTSWSVRSSGP